jgi:hypothetical protein
MNVSWEFLFELRKRTFESAAKAMPGPESQDATGLLQHTRIFRWWMKGSKKAAVSSLRYSPESLFDRIGAVMISRVWMAAAVLALAGCTSASDMLKKDPVFFGQTTKSPQAYAQCVTDGWRGQGEKVKMEAIDNGYDVVAEGTMGLSTALRVLQYANGKVDIRMSSRTTYGAQNLVQTANLCQ